MIVRYDSDGRPLADREALAQWLNRPADTIRDKLKPVACDAASRRVLYDADEVLQMDAATRRLDRAIDTG